MPRISTTDMTQHERDEIAFQEWLADHECLERPDYAADMEPVSDDELAEIFESDEG